MRHVLRRKFGEGGEARDVWSCRGVYWRVVFLVQALHGADMLAEEDERVVGTSACIHIKIDIVELVGSGFRGNKILVFVNVLDVVHGVGLGSCTYISPFLNFKIVAFKTRILSTLFEGVVGQDASDELAEKLVEAPVPFSIEEFAFQDMMEAARG